MNLGFGGIMVKPKTILFINQYFHPLNNPPAKRLKAFAEYFANHNWKINVITGMPNYPNGKLLKGYKWKLYRKEKYKDKVNVYRFFEIPLKLKGFFRIFLNYISFTISSFFGINLIRKADIVFISSPPIFSAVSNYFFAKLFKRKVVFDIRDLYPETAEELGLIKKKSFSYRFFENLNYKIFDYCHKIITVNYKLARKIQRKYNTKKVEVITNFASRKELKKLKTNSNKIKIAFTGVITEAQNLTRVMKLIDKFKKNIEFHIVGSGSEFDLLKKIVKNNKNVKLYGYQSLEFCNKIINQCDIGLITLVNKKLFESALPSKFFEYISFGKPILLNQSLELKRIVEKSNSGWFLDNDDKKIINIINNITKKEIDVKSRNAKKLFEKNYEKEIVCRKLFNIIT